MLLSGDSLSHRVDRNSRVSECLLSQFCKPHNILLIDSCDILIDCSLGSLGSLSLLLLLLLVQVDNSTVNEAKISLTSDNSLLIFCMPNIARAIFSIFQGKAQDTNFVFNNANTRRTSIVPTQFFNP